MSLLMDALRKAEEAKKQAEQEKTAEAASSKSTVTAPADTAAPDLSETEAKTETETEPPSSPDLSVKLQFEEESVPVASIPAAPSISEDLDKALETVSRTLDASAPKRPSLDLAADSSSSKGSGDVESFFSAQDIATTPSIPAEIELPVVSQPTEDKGFAGKDSKTDSERSIDYTVEPENAIDVVAPQQEPKPKQGKAAENRWEDPVSTISERTAKSRQSAKSVFAAKNSSAENKKAYLYGGAGIAAVVVFAGGYFLLSSGSSNTTFMIPEGNYVSANKTEYSDANSGNIERASSDVNDAQINQDNGLVSASAGTNSTAAEPVLGQTELASAAQERPVQAVPAGLDVTSSLAASLATVSAPPSVSSTGQAEADQPQAETPVAEVPTAVASASSTSQSEPVAISAADESLSDSATAAPNEPELDLISFRRKETSNQVSPQLRNAYSAYQAGNFDSALALYNQVLNNEPRNTDALLGKATISSAQGDTAQAMALYSTVLSLNPSQAIARSGLLNLLPTVSPADQERQLRRLITQYPGVAPLAFALGNFYASQSRWVDAQKNYFNALSLAKADSAQGAQVSPDYAFNLAISLDRLNQPGPAITYYQEALNLASQFPANFDVEIARARINRLTGSNTP